MKRKHIPKRGWNDLDPQAVGEYTRLQTDQKNTEQQLKETTKETTEKVGMGGSLGQVNSGGVVVGPGLGVSVFEGGILKSTIEPDGDVFFGSDISTPSGVSFATFVNEQYYNSELMEAGDVLIGDNTAGVSNVKFDASEGQLQFRFGQTVNVYMDTDGSLKAGGRAVTLDADGILVNEGGDAVVFRDGLAYGVLSLASTPGLGNKSLRLLAANVSTSTNRLTNGDFETGSLSSWTETDPGGTISISALGEGYGGGYAVHFDGSSSNDYITQTITASAYGLLLMFRLRVVSGNVSITANGTNLTDEFTTNGEWRNFHAVVPGSASSLELRVSGNASTESYVDDIVALPLTATGADGAASYLDVNPLQVRIHSRSFSIYDINGNDLFSIGKSGSNYINYAGNDVDTYFFGSGTPGGLPVLFIDAGNKRIGIKDITPSYELDVNGSINFTGSLYQNGSLFSGGGFELIEDKTLGADTANFDFQSIPGTYKHLEIRYSARSDRVATGDGVLVRLNNDSGGNYDYCIWYDGPAGAPAETAAVGATSGQVSTVAAASSPASAFDSGVIFVNDYAGSNHKEVQGRTINFQTALTTGMYIMDGYTKWKNTAAVTRITLIPSGGSNFKAGSRATLYGLK